MHNMVRVFFAGEELPRFITHTNLVLFPKKLEVNTFFRFKAHIIKQFCERSSQELFTKGLKEY